MEYFKLNDGNKMPALGFGTYRIDKKKAKEVVAIALQDGYRLIDTAEFYKNEAGVGEAIRESGIDRKEIFISSKVFPNNYGYKKTLKAIDGSLQRLGLKYMDMFLLHQGFGNYNAAWAALIDAQKAGKIKSIGVSNFTPEQIEELTKVSGVRPAINQIEISPFYQRTKEVDKLQSVENVQVESWASFANGKHDIFNNETLRNIAKKYNKTVGNVILRWLTQRNIVVIPKSVTPSRIKSNINIFDFKLDHEDILAIEKLDMNEPQFGMSQFGLAMMKLFSGRNKPWNKIKRNK